MNTNQKQSQPLMINVKYIVVGQDDEDRMNFISSLNFENKLSKIKAQHVSISRNIVLKNREDCIVSANMIDMPMIQLEKFEEYAQDSKGVILILKPTSMTNQDERINIPLQLIQEYCKILYHQIRVNREQLLKLIICFYQQPHTYDNQNLQETVYVMIRNTNKAVWNSLTESQLSQIIVDKTSQWRMRNIEMMRTHLKQNNFKLKKSLGFELLKQKIERRQQQKQKIRKQEQQKLLEMKEIKERVKKQIKDHDTSKSCPWDPCNIQ